MILFFVDLYHTWVYSADNNLVIFLFVFQKIGFDISSKMSPKETMCNVMSKALFWKNKKKYFQISSAEIFIPHVKGLKS